ncbi:hypothetical protein [Stackebrandtia soli]|uniref:hypothetical protein n=1 Tax=Stackebrandtia soli TaxID=1892856 RepID=UPI0039EC652B
MIMLSLLRTAAHPMTTFLLVLVALYSRSSRRRRDAHRLLTVLTGVNPTPGLTK